VLKFPVFHAILKKGCNSEMILEWMILPMCAMRDAQLTHKRSVVTAFIACTAIEENFEINFLKILKFFKFV